MNMDFVISDIQFNNLCQKELELQKQKQKNVQPKKNIHIVSHQPLS